MNRRTFLKSASVALAALALGIKTKEEIITHIGRGSLLLMDNWTIRKELVAHKLARHTEVTDEWLADSAIALEAIFI